MSGDQFKNILTQDATAPFPVSRATLMRFGLGVGVLRERVRHYDPVPSAARNDYFGGKQAAVIGNIDDKSNQNKKRPK